MATPDWAWQRDAACRGDDVGLFFGLDGERGDAKAQRERKAKAICSQCPVRNECLSYAVETRQLGFWGGLNDDQRQSERRRRQRRAGATAPTVDDKTCRDCGDTKLATEFHKDKRSKDGLLSSCRTCDVARRQRDTVEAVA
jgi:WhiB family redox-sensing transcriptional regulator